MIIFYDGECDFCTGRMEKLKEKDKNGVLTFEDINDPGLMLELYGLNYDDCLEEIHGAIPTTPINYVIYKGIDVYIVAHQLMGYKRYYQFLKNPGHSDVVSLTT